MTVLPDLHAEIRSAGVPTPAVDAALRRPGTSRIVVTACGFTSATAVHRVTRPGGIPEAFVGVCVRGRAEVEVEGARHALDAGRLVVIPPHVPHEFLQPHEDTWELWWMHAMGPDIPDLLRSSGLTPADPVREIRDPYRMVALIEEALRAIARDVTEPSLLAASGAAWHLFALLLTTSRAVGDIVSPVDRARDHLRDHFADPLSVESLARLTNLSPSHFSAVFRRRFGISAMAYLSQLRMARARELLDSTDAGVAQIAARVGYTDPSYFARRFLLVHGVTPRVYRSQRTRVDFAG